VAWVVLSPVLRPWARARARARLGRPPPPPDEPPAPDPAAWDGRTAFVVAGETSGDLLASRVVRAMRARCPGLRFRGYAGRAAEEAGVALDRDLVSGAVFGVFPVIASLPTWWRLCAETSARLRDEPPDLFLTVDYPGLNGRLARWARRAGVPTVHVVAPALWAYAPWRVLRWRRAVDRVLALFPFEPSLFAGSGLETVFVGHPFFEAPLPPPRTPERWPGDGPVTVELLPGSRRREVLAHVPEVLDAARRLEATFPAARFVARLAREEHRAWFDAAAARAPSRPARLEVRVGRARDDGPPLLGALACSGTVTAELAGGLVPMTSFYRIGLLTRIATWTILCAPWYTLPNLVLGEGLVGERGFVRRGVGALLADDLLAVAGTAERWAAHRERLREARRRLEAPGVADRMARAALAPRAWRPDRG
jgi:lipid-A-disaccharide synthase